MSALDELIADVERLASSVIEVKIDGEIYGVPISSIGKLLAIVKCMREGLTSISQPTSTRRQSTTLIAQQTLAECERLAGKE